MTRKKKKADSISIENQNPKGLSTDSPTDQENRLQQKDQGVTWVEDLYGIQLAEISDAQNSPEEVPEDLPEEELEDLPAEDLPEENLVEEVLEDLPEDQESIEAQLDRLAKAISTQTEDPIEILKSSLDSAEELLARQIEEDRALLQEEESFSKPLLTQVEFTNQETETQNLQDSESEKIAGIVLESAEIQSCVEAILFLSDKPVSAVKLRDMLNPELSFHLFQEAMDELCRRYQASHHGVEIVEVGGGYQLRTKPDRADLAQKLVKIQTQRLSSGAMETLAIIAYQQPIMKEEIDKIRGVDSSYFIRNLMDRKLIRITGRSELPGRPILYSTSPEFLEIFGLKDLSSLPPLRELERMIPGSQSANPGDEDPRVREMRRLVGEMKSDQSSALYYNPKEDEKILKEIREKVSSIPSSTPYLDELKAQEALAAQMAAEGALPAENQETPGTAPAVIPVSEGASAEPGNL